ncbi:hypothetical protein QR680_017599 [Steinernema hermaphroditum]|uniref:Uncharacterized protein n=1 Tax=Steinernema hermaphroditum TaxID=289476 RepID=A0AA39HGC5_9BILA|nr:hypothetical protein QR680_017599 [Steinernema hermaphroditum]
MSSSSVPTTPTTTPVDCSPYFFNFYITFMFDTGHYGQNYKDVQLQVPDLIDNSTVPQSTIFNYYGISTTNYYGSPFNRWNTSKAEEEMQQVKASSEDTLNITLTDALKHFRESGDASFKNSAVGVTLVIFVGDTVTDAEEATVVAKELQALNPPVVILVVGRSQEAVEPVKPLALATYVARRLGGDGIVFYALRHNEIRLGIKTMFLRHTMPESREQWIARLPDTRTPRPIRRSASEQLLSGGSRSYKQTVAQHQLDRLLDHRMNNSLRL